MSININTAVKADLEELLSWVQNTNEEDLKQLQAETMTVLGLLTNDRFYLQIQDLRKEHNVPEHWHTPKNNTNFYEEYVNYLQSHKTAPTGTFDPVVIKICDDFHIERKKYSEFISNYLLFGTAQVLKPPHLEWFEHFYATDEYRNKASIELDYGEGKAENLTENPQAAYIRIYKDTSKTGLISFIEKNWLAISHIQKQLNSYPHTKRYGKFQRDIQIYIYHLLGNKTPVILDKLAEKSIYIEETAVRQTVADFDKRIELLFTPDKV